jgi:uncharacterized glyoxalase superfamily protein PhnB
MPKRIDFLHEHPVNFFGAFYPLGYVVLAFQQRNEAEQVRKRVMEAGFEEADVTILGADDLIETEGGEGGHADSFASALAGETKIMEKHRELAKSGATFLMVFAPDTVTTERVAKIVEDFSPLTADKYERLTIHGL